MSTVPTLSEIREHLDTTTQSLDALGDTLNLVSRSLMDESEDRSDPVLTGGVIRQILVPHLVRDIHGLMDLMHRMSVPTDDTSEALENNISQAISSEDTPEPVEPDVRIQAKLIIDRIRGALENVDDGVEVCQTTLNEQDCEADAGVARVLSNFVYTEGILPAIEALRELRNALGIEVN